MIKHPISFYRRKPIDVDFLPGSKDSDECRRRIAQSSAADDFVNNSRNHHVKERSDLNYTRKIKIPAPDHTIALPLSSRLNASKKLICLKAGHNNKLRYCCVIEQIFCFFKGVF